HWAINLDGGGSSTLVARDFDLNRPVTLNVPSDGTQRYVPDGIGLLSKEGEASPSEGDGDGGGRPAEAGDAGVAEACGGGFSPLFGAGGAAGEGAEGENRPPFLQRATREQRRLGPLSW